jgi:hypothetical protein
MKRLLAVVLAIPLLDVSVARAQATPSAPPPATKQEATPALPALSAPSASQSELDRQIQEAVQ